MTDRIAGEGADDFAVANPDTAVSGLGAAGWVQGRIADNVAAGLTNPITRATVAGKLQYLASLVAGGGGFNALDSDGNSFSVPLAVLDSDGNIFTITTAFLDSDGNSFTVI